MAGGTQAGVWRLSLAGFDPGSFVLRVVHRPTHLVQRQQAVVERARRAGAPVAAIRFVADVTLGDQAASVQIMDWVAGTHPRRFEAEDAAQVGRGLGILHRALRGREQEHQFPDRPLRLGTYRGYVQQLEAFGESEVRVSVERHQKALRVWEEFDGVTLPRQLLHGDAHRGNVVLSGSSATFIDFDKMMVGPRVFDIAKYIATCCFHVGVAARLSRRSIDALLDGYNAVNRLSERELASLFSLCIILNTENALFGIQASRPDLLADAARIGRWWEVRRRGRHLSGLRRVSAATPPRQLQLFG